ncbi:MAG: signal peptidase II [Candidatus Magasanikbacteria bacterium]|nr:signal peptidase II [Candidatus Magasanikbacteria bacterium]
MFYKRPLIIFSGLFLFLLDQFLKRKVLGVWEEPRLFLNNWLGWQQFKNSGVAFGLPVPINVAIIFSVLILVVLIYYFLRAARAGRLVLALGFWLIIIGAVSNLIDRAVFGATIDYIRILTGVFNIADGCILIGGLLLIFGEQHWETVIDFTKVRRDGARIDEIIKRL